MFRRVICLGLNKINYVIEPSKFNKEDGGKCLGQWKKFQTEDNVKFNSKKPYYVMFKDGYAGIDFDVATKKKLLHDQQKVNEAEAAGRKYESKYKWLKKELRDKILAGKPMPDPWKLIKPFLELHGLPTQDDCVFIVKSGTGGLHYYCRVKAPKNFIMKPGSFFGNIEHVSFDFKCGLFTTIDSMDENGNIIKGGVVGGGSLFYGPGTHWKDTDEYVIFKGSEATIPEVDGWRVSWLLGKFKWEIAHFKLADFLNGNIDVHGDQKAHEHELVIWKETLYTLKQLGYMEGEINTVFSKLPGYDQNKSNNQIKSWWNKEFNDPQRVRAHLPGQKKSPLPPASVPNPAPVIPVSNPSQPVNIGPGSGTGSPGSPPIIKIEIEPGLDYYEMFNFGIDHVKVKVFKSGNTLIKRRQIWNWKDFKIANILYEKDADGLIEYFNYQVDGKIYRDDKLNEMLSTVYEGRSAVVGEEKNIFGPLAREYVRLNNVPVLEYRDTAGFTKIGWIMPDKHWIIFRAPFHKQEREFLEAMCKIVTNEADAKNYMKIMYDNVNVGCLDADIKANVKDVLFTYNTIAPFMSAMEGYVELMPMLAVGSMGGSTGKSTLLRLFTEKWYGFPHNVNADNIESTSRFGDYLTFSTFPILMDDLGKLKDTHRALLKTILAGKARDQKKDKSNKFFTIDKPYVTPPYITYNEIPDLFDDMKILERAFVVPIDKRLTGPDFVKYDLIKSMVPDAYLGKYMYDKTHDWNLETLKEKYKTIIIPIESGLKGTREIAIYKLVHLGAMLFYEFFGIKLNLDYLEDLVKRTLKTGSDNVFNVVLAQIENKEKDKKDRPRGIESEVYEQDGEYRFNTVNAIEISNYLKIKFSLPSLAEILQKRWGNVKYKASTYLGKNHGSCVIIPKADIANDMLKTTDPTEQEKKTKDVIEQAKGLIVDILTSSEQGMSKAELEKYLNEKLKCDLSQYINLAILLSNLQNDKMIDIIPTDNEDFKVKLA